MGLLCCVLCKSASEDLDHSLCIVSSPRIYGIDSLSFLGCLGFAIWITVLCWKRCFCSLFSERKEGFYGRLASFLFCGDLDREK